MQVNIFGLGDCGGKHVIILTNNVSVFQSSNVPFRRIVEEKIEVDPRLADNSFEAKVSSLTSAKLTEF